MKYLLTFCCALLAFTSAQAQFKTSGDELMIMVSDGTKDGKNSEVVRQRDVPKSYDQVSTIGGGSGGGKGKSKGKNGMTFTDPIRSLGMTNCIQAAAFLERPVYGLSGYMLIFSINDAIGGKQATITMQDGKSYQGVYRLVRQKTSDDEKVPAGMTTYQVEGTFFLLGVS